MSENRVYSKIVKEKWFLCNPFQWGSPTNPNGRRRDAREANQLRDGMGVMKYESKTFKKTTRRLEARQIKDSRVHSAYWLIFTACDNPIISKKKEHGTWGRLSMKRTDWNWNALGDTIRYLIKRNGKCMLLVLCKSLLKREDFSHFQLGCLWVRLIHYPFSYHFCVTIQCRDGHTISHPIHHSTRKMNRINDDNHMIQLVI